MSERLTENLAEASLFRHLEHSTNSTQVLRGFAALAIANGTAPVVVAERIQSAAEALSLTASAILQTEETLQTTAQ